MQPEIVVPMHVVRQLDLQLTGRAERLTVDELRLQYLVRRLVDGVVVWAPFLDSDRSMPKASSISSIFALSNSEPLSVWNTLMSDIGSSSVANAALTRSASLRGPAECPIISRLRRSTSRQTSSSLLRRARRSSRCTRGCAARGRRSSSPPRSARRPRWARRDDA